MAFRRLLRARRSTLAIVGLALALGGLATWSDLSRTLNNLVEPLRFSVLHRKASGNVVVVEMDAASASAIKRWPWSRAHYAAVVDSLRRAGAASIVFDVDLSSSSDTAGDLALAAALKRSGGIVALPTFGQQAGSGDARMIDALPIALFRPDVALASVNVAPDADGLVRDMPFATITAGTPRPSLASYIAGRSGKADDAFPIDMSIDPNTIPRLSFIAVRDGRYDPAVVKGRNVLIGATAIEMGDRYGTGSWGVIPGVVIQALAAETLIRGVPIDASAFPVIVLAALLSCFLATVATLPRLLGWGTVSVAVLIGVVCVAQHALYVFLPIASGMIVLGASLTLAAGRLLYRQFRTLRLSDEATGLPNRRAMLAAGGLGGGPVVVLRIVNFEDLVAVLGSGAEVDAIRRVADRASLLAVGARVFRITDRALAFTLGTERPVDEGLDGFRAIMLQPVEVAGRRVDVATSAGVAEDRSKSVDELLNDAARAAETASDEGVFWRRAAVDVDALERQLTLMGELDAAIENGQLEVYYQPKLDLRTNRVASAEALIRWRHPDRGFVPPDVFIPLAEQADRIAPLTLHVLARTLEDLTTLRRAGHRLSLAVNISAKLLTSDRFTQTAESMIASSGMPASALVFEVTESAAMSNPEVAIAALNRFRALGISVSMDDYGTGQSTLTYLRQLPLTELKIDRSFVQYAHLNNNDGLLVRSTIDLAHQLDLKVVAEGVEDRECLTFLRDAGCDMVQGYFVSRPVPFDAFFQFVAEADRGRLQHAS